ncbi:unnamed protein product, partial [Rotaria magnacalcarata]
SGGDDYGDYAHDDADGAHDADYSDGDDYGDYAHDDADGAHDADYSDDALHLGGYDLDDDLF